MDDLSNDEVESLSQAMGDGVATEDATNGETPPPAEAVKDAPPEANEPESPAKSEEGISRAQFMQLEEIANAADLPPNELKRMHDIKVNVEVLLGTAKMPLEEILKLQPGSTVELNRLAGEPVDIFANDQLIARAEVVVVDDSFGVKILEIAGTVQKLKVLDN